jgi:hypothetical protein
MRRKPERLRLSPRAGDDLGSAASLADASTPADNPADKTRRSKRRGTATLNRPQPTGSPLDIVSQDGDKTLDLTAVHDAVAILLVRYHQKVRSERMTGDLT